MQNIIHSIADFFTPKPVSIIEAVNDCGEKRYIETERVLPLTERNENLKVLFTKCKRLLSFVTKKSWDEDICGRIVKLTQDVRLSMYKNDDITSLIQEYETVENYFKKGSKSSINLSKVMMMG